MNRVLLVMMFLVFFAMSQPVTARPVDYVPVPRYAITVDGEQLTVPMLYTHDPSVPHPEMTRCVLFSSNGTREILPTALSLEAAGTSANALDHTMLIGLQFLQEQDLDPNALEDDVAYWLYQWWFVGNASDSTAAHPRPVRTSSFTFLDSLLVEVVTNNPQLETISVVGESAGGKLIHRWGAVTRLYEEMDLPPMVYVTSANGNFMYMDPYRYDHDDEWTIPGPTNQEIVPNWNGYPYGLEDLNTYCSLTGADYIESNFVNRNCFYFVGDGDTGLNSDDKPMNMQGMNNLMRHVFFWEHLVNHYGNTINYRQQLYVMEGFGHNGHDIIENEACYDLIFNYIPPPDPITFTLTPLNSIVPQGGGNVTYQASLVSIIPDTYNAVDYWSMITIPNGNIVGPTFMATFNMTPYMNVTVNLAQNIPGFAPAGTYTLTGRIGWYPTPMLSDSFEFTKVGAAANGNEYSEDLSYWRGRGDWSGADQVTTTSTELPAEYALHQVWPNPFNTSTLISVSLPETADLNVKVFNVTGQQVAVLANGEFGAGLHNLNFEASDLASGIYLVRATVSGKLDATQKVTLVK